MIRSQQTKFFVFNIFSTWMAEVGKTFALKLSFIYSAVAEGPSQSWVLLGAFGCGSKSKRERFTNTRALILHSHLL